MAYHRKPRRSCRRQSTSTGPGKSLKERREILERAITGSGMAGIPTVFRYIRVYDWVVPIDANSVDGYVGVMWKFEDGEDDTLINATFDTSSREPLELPFGNRVIARNIEGFPEELGGPAFIVGMEFNPEEDTMSAYIPLCIVFAGEGDRTERLPDLGDLDTRAKAIEFLRSIEIKPE